MFTFFAVGLNVLLRYKSCGNFKVIISLLGTEKLDDFGH